MLQTQQLWKDAGNSLQTGCFSPKDEQQNITDSQFGVQVAAFTNFIHNWWPSRSFPLPTRLPDPFPNPAAFPATLELMSNSHR